MNTPTEQQFLVQGMTCGHCEMAVKQALWGLDPQAQVSIKRSSGEMQAQVQVQSTQNREALAQAIREEGYEVA